MKKYGFTGEVRMVNGTIVRRIVALMDFGNVKKGDLGGWIEREHNLSYEGNCWVYDSAAVFDYARVCGNALVSGNARVYGAAYVGDTSRVLGCTWVYGDTMVYGNALIFGNSDIKTGEFAGNDIVYNNKRGKDLDEIMGGKER